MKTLVIDVETTIRSTVHGSSPFCPENRMVLLGVLAIEEDGTTHTTITRMPTPDDCLKLLITPALLVGHNIAYDLKWLWHQAAKTGAFDLAYSLDISRVWDTQQAEYLLSGQSQMFPSLDATAPLYGGTVKDNKIGEYWDAGVDTMDIPPEELDAYLREDLNNTLLVFQGQHAILEHPNLGKLRELAQVKMDDVVMSALMEYNGMAFDLGHASTFLDNARSKIESTRSIFESSSSEILKNWTPSISSNKDVGTLLFGGVYDVVSEEAVGVYKTGPRKGSPKFRKLVEKVAFPGIVSIAYHALSNPTATGGWQVGDEVLTKVLEKDKSKTVQTIVPLIVAWRNLNKEASTYLEGYSKMVTPDGKIHPSINNCSTATGRQSCTKPNLQNVSGVDDE